ncbi:hypothetical protein [Paenibacillus polymyxa]|uniref:hypothetical protein n=1 Tax=Paenibacillus polymyxa TaxID=1406 RepID=UPI0018AD5894|nr:hypothetical protein [Paenibacillus polymyxa]
MASLRRRSSIAYPHGSACSTGAAQRRLIGRSGFNRAAPSDTPFLLPPHKVGD